MFSLIHPLQGGGGHGMSVGRKLLQLVPLQRHTTVLHPETRATASRAWLRAPTEWLRAPTEWLRAPTGWLRAPAIWIRTPAAVGIRSFRFWSRNRVHIRRREKEVVDCFSSL